MIFPSSLCGADESINYSSSWSKKSNEIFKNSNIEMVQVTGAGIDDLTRVLSFNKIAVCNVQGVSAFAVAEYCIASAITLSRQLHLGNMHLRKENMLPSAYRC